MTTNFTATINANLDMFNSPQDVTILTGFNAQRDEYLAFLQEEEETHHAEECDRRLRRWMEEHPEGFR